MTTTKMNIGVSLSKNYNTIKLEFLDKEIEHDTMGVLRSGIQYTIEVLKKEINIAHDKIEQEKQ